jgi:hydroxyacylglutathione hydrolase
MLSIDPIPAFQDNYIWCLHDGGSAWVVDPGDAEPVEAFLTERNLRLDGLLITHHHSDHTGGIAELVRKYGLQTVYGPRNPAIAGITHRLKEGDSVSLLGLDFQVFEVPGHTLDHIAYFLATTQPLVFCGDTLFAAGCGRLFEGTAPQMYASLQKLAALPAATKIYCTHEYTLSNLHFALAVEPDNLATQARVISAQSLRKELRPTLPSTLQLELETNPFLRADALTVQTAALQHGAIGTENSQIFAALRTWKDHF